jgi:hypothetical protein
MGIFRLTVISTRTSNLIAREFSFLTEIPQQLEKVTGVSFVVLLIVVIGLLFLIALLFDSSQGRGRRYRRGYRVAYTEQLGKERAKLRAQQEREGKKKSGIRER